MATPKLEPLNHSVEIGSFETVAQTALVGAGQAGKGGRFNALRTGPKERRCSGHAPSLSSAA